LLLLVVALPLVFIPSEGDAYALPKAVVLRGVGLLGAMLFIAHVVVGGSLRWSPSRWIDIALACFVALFVLASITSVDRAQSFVGEPFQFQGTVTTLVYVGAFLAARLSMSTVAGFRSLLVALAATGALVSLYGVVQSLGIDPFWPGRPDPRIISTLGQANDLAAYLDLVLVAVVALAALVSQRRRALLAIVAVMSVVALALTYSRGGYLGALPALGALLLVRPGLPMPRRVSAAPMLVGAVVVAVLALPIAATFGPKIVDRIAAIGDTSESSARFHQDVWRVGIQIAIDHPWLGTGPETFPVVFRPYLSEVLPPDRAERLGRFRLESPHNELIGIAAEEGLPALVAYLAFLGGCAALAIRRVRATSGTWRTIGIAVLATLATHLITTTFKTPDTTTSAIFWILLGSGIGAIEADTRVADTASPAPAAASPGRALCCRGWILPVVARREPCASSSPTTPRSSAKASPG
jgi:O-antigen ligase